MKVTHYGEDYCYITIGNVDMECPIAVGKGIDKDKTEIVGLKDEIAELKERLKQRNQIIQEKSNELCKLIDIRNQLAEAKDTISRRNKQVADLRGQVKKTNGLHEIYCGAFETMKKVAYRGVQALNPKTHKWQTVDKTAKYYVMPDGIGATLFSNLDLNKIAKEKDLII